MLVNIHNKQHRKLSLVVFYDISTILNYIKKQDLAFKYIYIVCVCVCVEKIDL